MVDPSDVDTLDDIELAIAELRRLAEASGSVSETLKQIRVLAGDGPVPPGLHLLNAHLGKGQQVDWVFVIGLEDGYVPDFRAKTDAELQEEERSLLVMLRVPAMTRDHEADAVSTNVASGTGIPALGGPASAGVSDALDRYRGVPRA